MKTYIIAEIGINYNGSLDVAKEMIDVAKDSGCDSAKFQLFSSKNLYPKSAGTLDWKDDEKEYSYDIYEAVKNFELPTNWIDELIAYCNIKEIDFMASIFDISGLNFLVEKGIKKLKLSSYTITNIPLIEASAKTGIPIIMSTGGSTISETEEALNTILKYHNKVTLLHCSIQYPTKLEDVNMGVLETFKFAFPHIPIGYSDHTKEVSEAPVQSIYLGGSVVEKHITLDKKMEGPDHFFALEPQELKQMVSDIRKAEQEFDSEKIQIDKRIYGSSQKICYSHEKYLRDFAYMTLYAKRDIKVGEIISKKDISILRPGKKIRGLEPKYLKLFENNKVTAKKDIKFEEPIIWETIL